MKTQSTALCEVKKEPKFKAVVMRIGKKNIIIACSVLMIGLAVLLNFILFTGSDPNQGFDGYDQPSGNISDNLNNDSNPTDSDAGTYFSATQVSRQRARDEALEVLQAVVDNAEASEVVKNQISSR